MSNPINVSFSNTFSTNPMTQSQVAAGTTVNAFLSTQGGVPENGQVRVNRAAADLNAVLQPGDIVSVVPTQIKGA